MSKRVALRLAVLAGLMLTSPVLAHENHEELGAGPGPAVEQNVVAAEKAEAVDMHSEMAAEHGEAMGQHMEAAEENKTFGQRRSEEHTSELQSLMRISYAVYCLKKKQKR